MADSYILYHNGIKTGHFVSIKVFISIVNWIQTYLPTKAQQYEGNNRETLTSIRPVVVWPEISSPAQSLASVMKVPSNSCFPCRAAFCSFCLGSLGESSGSLRQQTNAQARHNNTTRKPARNVKIEDRRKHHHFLTLRHSGSDGAVVVPSSDEAIPGREASRQASARRARATRALARCPRATERGRGPPRARCRAIDPRVRPRARRRRPATGRPCWT